MQVICFEQLDELPAQAASALSCQSGQDFFSSLEWFRCLFSFGVDATMRPRIYLASDDSGAQCALFCLQPGAGQLQSMTSFYTIRYCPVELGDNHQKGLAAIIEFIAGEQPQWNTFDLRFLRDDGPQLQPLLQALSVNQFSCYRYPQYENWFLKVSGRSFANYYQRLPSKLRNTIERKTRQLQRSHKLTLQIFPRDAVNLDDAIHCFETVYNNSWKKQEPHPNFMPGLIRETARLGIARIGLAHIDGEPAAAQIWIRNNHRAYIYKLAYDERFKATSIGSILSKNLFEYAIDTDKVAEIDYGVGSEPYKKDWMSDVRQLGGVLACNTQTVRGKLLHWREYLAHRTRRLRNR